MDVADKTQQVRLSRQCSMILSPQERVCEDSASFDLNSLDIAHCISDVGQLLVAKTEEESLEEGVRQWLSRLIEKYSCFMCLATAI